MPNSFLNTKRQLKQDPKIGIFLWFDPKVQCLTVEFRTVEGGEMLAEPVHFTENDLGILDLDKMIAKDLVVLQAFLFQKRFSGGKN
jgi:hypothetical protein